MKKSIELSIILQSAPTLIISLVGLLLTGILFSVSVNNKNFKLFPIILESSCIICFKGNIELSFAMHITSSEVRSLEKKEYSFFLLFNVCVLLTQSLLIGAVAGTLGVLNTLINGLIDYSLYVQIMMSALLTCFVSSLVFVILLLITIKTADYLKIDVENVILPFLSSANDLIIVYGLIVFSSLQLRISLYESIFIGFLLVVAFCICSFIISFGSKHVIPLQAYNVLGIASLFSIFSGYIIERYSHYYPYLAYALPVFSGMCGSICYIDIHKKFININGDSDLDISSEYSLLFTAFIVSTLYIIFAYFIRTGFTLVFSLSFIVIFCIQVLVLLYIINKLVDFLKKGERGMNVNILPIMASISDFLSAFSLITITVIIHSFKSQS